MCSILNISNNSSTLRKINAHKTTHIQNLINTVIWYTDGKNSISSISLDYKVMEGTVKNQLT